MDSYLLIESRDALESSDVATYFYDLAAGLARERSPVTLFLVQNGVFPARRGAQTGALSAVARPDVEILADEFARRVRGSPRDRLERCVVSGPIDVVVDRLVQGPEARRDGGGT